MNKAILIGRLTADPESRMTQNGTQVTTFTIAVDRRFKKGEEKTDFFTCVAWRILAEICGKYLSKGKKVAVIGEIQNRSYEAKDGSKKYVTEIVLDEMEMLSPKNEGSSEPQKSTFDGFTEVSDDDLPF